MSDARVAATVLILRPVAAGWEVFVVQRNRNVGFLPNAWVFPGGRAEPADRLAGHPRVRGGAKAVAALGLPADDAVAVLVAGVRETFEETGIWLGSGSIPDDVRPALAQGDTSLAALLDEHDANVDLDRLAPWAWWITPTSEPKRYDTRFFVAIADAPGRHDDVETVNSGWFTASDLVAGADAGKFPMAPPTWWTLQEIAAHPTAEAVWAAAWARPQRPIQPILHLSDAGFELWLPGHPSHPEPAFPGLPPRVTFHQGRWWAAPG